MIRRPPRSTLDRSSAASDVYKRQELHDAFGKTVGMGRFLVGMHQKFFGDLRRRQAFGGEVVALVAQHAHQLGGQGVVEQLDDVDTLSLIHISEPTRPY